MGINPIDAENMLRRLERNRVREPVQVTLPEKGCDSEAKLHREIMDWCDQQWPQWPYLHARMDQPTTFGPGVHDLTIWGPFPLCICVEAKAHGKKQTEKQLEWSCKMRMQNWTVFLCYSFESFLEIVKKQNEL